jgi:hypothetical protein
MTITDEITINLQKPYLTTAEAAALLNRKPQTLRKWHCLQNGPIRAWVINGRLMWPTGKLRELLRI